MYKWLKSKTFSNSHSTIFVLFVAVAESKDKTHGLKISGNLFRRACLVFWQIENFHENFYFLIIFTFCCNLFPVIIYLKPAHHYFLLKKKTYIFWPHLKLSRLQWALVFWFLICFNTHNIKKKLTTCTCTHTLVSRQLSPPALLAPAPAPFANANWKKLNHSPTTN